MIVAFPGLFSYFFLDVISRTVEAKSQDSSQFCLYTVRNIKKNVF